MSISICYYCGQERDPCCVWQRYYQKSGNDYIGSKPDWSSQEFVALMQKMRHNPYGYPDIEKPLLLRKEIRPKDLGLHHDDDEESFDWLNDYGIESIKII
jgi:hypothetical protein